MAFSLTNILSLALEQGFEIDRDKICCRSSVLLFGIHTKISPSDANLQTFDLLRFAHAQLWTPEFSQLHFQNIPVALRMLKDSLCNCSCGFLSTDMVSWSA